MISYNAGLEKLCLLFVKYLLVINELKKYNDRNPNFNNFILILRGIFEEMTEINTKFLNEILKYYNKKENPYNYYLTSKFLSIMKNLLGTPINNLILKIVNQDEGVSKVKTNLLTLLNNITY